MREKYIHQNSKKGANGICHFVVLATFKIAKIPTERTAGTYTHRKYDKGHKAFHYCLFCPIWRFLRVVVFATLKIANQKDNEICNNGDINSLLVTFFFVDGFAFSCRVRLWSSLDGYNVKSKYTESSYRNAFLLYAPIVLI